MDAVLPKQLKQCGNRLSCAQESVLVRSEQDFVPDAPVEFEVQRDEQRSRFLFFHFLVETGSTFIQRFIGLNHLVEMVVFDDPLSCLHA